MSDDIYFGPGTTPDKVAEAVERSKQERREESGRPRPTTRDRERFFANMAELIKRAEAT